MKLFEKENINTIYSQINPIPMYEKLKKSDAKWNHVLI